MYEQIVRNVRFLNKRVSNETRFQLALIRKSVIIAVTLEVFFPNALTTREMNTRDRESNTYSQFS